MKSKLFWRNIIWALIIFMLCAIPGDDLPKTSMIEIPYFDKMVHFGMFFIMGIFICSELTIQTQWNRMRIALFTLGIVALYGGGIEILQHSYFKNRSGDLKDFLADIAGGLVAIFLFPWVKKQKDLLMNRKPFNKMPFLRKIL